MLDVSVCRLKMQHGTDSRWQDVDAGQKKL
jgi:hypothetical protein